MWYQHLKCGVYVVYQHLKYGVYVFYVSGVRRSKRSLDKTCVPMCVPIGMCVPISDF